MIEQYPIYRRAAGTLRLPSPEEQAVFLCNMVGLQRRDFDLGGSSRVGRVDPDRRASPWPSSLPATADMNCASVSRSQPEKDRVMKLADVRKNAVAMPLALLPRDFAAVRIASSDLGTSSSLPGMSAIFALERLRLNGWLMPPLPRSFGLSPNAPHHSRSGAKLIQTKPRKTKQIQEKCLDLLGLIRPNRDFSTGYSDSK